MRFSRFSFAALCLALGSAGCSSLLGLDDFTEDGTSGGTESTSSTEAGPTGPGTGTGTASGGSGPGSGPSSTDTTSTQQGPGGGEVGGGGSGPGELEVTPGEAKVGILRGLQLEANVDVEWSVDEADGGSIDAEGFYVSPATAGTYHVTATSGALSTTVEIDVVGLNAVLVGGIPGGSGNIDGPAKKAHFDRPGGIVSDQNGERIFIADTRNHTIRKWEESTNSVTTLAGKPGESGTEDGNGPDARFNEPTAIAVGSKVFVIDSQNNCIRAVNATNGATTTLAGQCGVAGSTDAGQGANVTFDRPEAMAISGDGSKLYVCQSGATRSIRTVNTTTGGTSTIVTNLNIGTCAMGADHFHQAIYYVDNINGVYVIRGFADPYSPAAPPVTVTSIPDYTQAMGVLTGFGGEDDIFFPYREDVGATTNQYVLDYNFGDDEVYADPWFGQGEAYVDGPFDVAQTTGIRAMYGDSPDGSVYFSDESGDSIRRADFYDEEVETVLGAPPNIVPVDGAKSVARLPTPVGIALDGAGFAYESNFGEVDNQIRRVDLATGEITSVAGTSGDIEQQDIVDGPPGVGAFGFATDVVFLEGALYVTDYAGNAVRRVDLPDGEITTIAGELLTPGFVDGIGNQARFQFGGGGDGIGGGITTDGVDLYVCDTGNFAIRKIDVSTGTVTTVAGGTEGSSDGVGAAAQFVAPTGLAYLDGMLYVADWVDSTIRQIDLATGEVTTIAGRHGELGDIDGGPGVATFTTPFRLVPDGIGNLYVSEVQGSTIRRISLDDLNVTTLVGTYGRRGVNPSPLPTTLNCPCSMNVDRRGGDLYFVDACDGVMMKLEAL